MGKESTEREFKNLERVHLLMCVCLLVFEWVFVGELQCLCFGVCFTVRVCLSVCIYVCVLP